MPRQLQTIDELQKYLSGVSERAAHHAQNVSEAILALAGAIVMFKDPGSNLEVHERDGELKNALWLRVRGNRFALSYDHDSRSIEIRERSTRGPARGKITNHTQVLQIIELFDGLAAATAR